MAEIEKRLKERLEKIQQQLDKEYDRTTKVAKESKDPAEIERAGEKYFRLDIQREKAQQALDKHQLKQEKNPEIKKMLRENIKTSEREVEQTKKLMKEKARKR